MSILWVREFTGGLDARRMPEATSGGVLIRANNGHITRGGEFEQRAAFVPTYALPAGTVGLFYDPAGVKVFGHLAAPTLPTGVTYQRLQHPTPATALTRVLSTDLYAGKIYAVGEFADGSIHHFYDGVRVTDWFDGRARATFEVTGGVVNSPIPASGSFDVTGGTAGGGNEVTNVLIDGVDALGAPVAWATSNAVTAAAIASQINSYGSTPDYTATSTGPTVTIVAALAGATANGRVVAPTVGGDVTVGNLINLAGGANSATSQVADLKINGVSVISAPVPWGVSNEDTAIALASAINGYTSVPDYTASSAGAFVNLAAATSGPTPNGYAVNFTLVNGFTVDPASGVLAGGDTFGGSQATGSFTVVAGGTVGATIVPRINAVNLVAAPVVWNADLTANALAIANAINAHVSTPDYIASAAGPVVTIKTATRTASVNGQSPTFAITGTYPTGSIVAMAGGEDDDAYTPGEFVLTIGKKVYSVSGPNLHFSGIQAPTKWTTDAVGAGFIDMSTESSGSEALTAISRYQNFAAIFSERVIQIWYIDPDPALNRQVQVLNNTGTDSPRSVTAFGDGDTFYMAENGVRSLRARDSSNSAATTDIGVPVDDLIVAKLGVLNDNDRQRIIGLIEPRDGRFWLIMKDQIFVFSYFTGAKVSAWSTYDTAYQSGDIQVPFDVEDAVVFRRRVYLRAEDTIYAYGGVSTGTENDAAVAEAWLPYMDADSPTDRKNFTAFDAAIRGLWEVAAAMEPTNTAAEDKVGTYDSTTYNRDRNTLRHRATHISLRFRSQGVGPHRLGACVIHYSATDATD